MFRYLREGTVVLEQLARKATQLLRYVTNTPKEKPKSYLLCIFFTFWKAYLYQEMDPQKTKTLPIHKICTCPQHGVHLAKYPVLLDRQSYRLSNHVTMMTPDPQTGILRDWPCGCFLGVTPPRGLAGEEGPSPGHNSVRRLCSTQLQRRLPSARAQAFRQLAKQLGSSIRFARVQALGPNCIKDYFGLRMSLISQVLTVVCRLEDLKFPIVSHTNQEGKAF